MCTASFHRTMTWKVIECEIPISQFEEGKKLAKLSADVDAHRRNFIVLNSLANVFGVRPSVSVTAPQAVKILSVL